MGLIRWLVGSGAGEAVEDAGYFGVPTVDGQNPEPVDMVNILLQYLQGFVHVRWCRISSINGDDFFFTVRDFHRPL